MSFYLKTWSGPKWTSIMDITTVLLTIQSLLDIHYIMNQTKKCKPYENTLYNFQIIRRLVILLLLKNYFDPQVLFVSFKEMDNENK